MPTVSGLTRKHNTFYDGGMKKAVVSKREAERILSDAGYQMVKMGRHEIWANGSHRLSLPHTPSSGGLYGWLANQIRKIEAGKTPAKQFERNGA